MLSSAPCGATLLAIAGLAALCLPGPGHAADPSPQTDVGLFVRSGGEWIEGADPSPVLGDALVAVDTALSDADGTPLIRARIEGRMAPDVTLREARLTGTVHRSFELAAGEMVLPVVRSVRISPAEALFFERPLLARLVPERGIGVQAAGHLWHDRIAYAVGAFGPASGDDPDDAMRFGGRVAGRLPLGDSAEIDAEFGAMNRAAHGRREAQRQLFGGAGVRWSSVTVRCEVVDARFDASGAVGIDALGAQVTAAIALPWQMRAVARWGRTVEGTVTDAQVTVGISWLPWAPMRLALEFIGPTEGTLPSAVRLYGQFDY